MKARAWPRIEPLALIAATLATAMAACYVWLIHQQGDQPLPWVLALLLAGALLAVYGAIRQLPYRRAALLAAGAAHHARPARTAFHRAADHRLRLPGPGLDLALTSTASAVMTAPPPTPTAA